MLTVKTGMKKYFSAKLIEPVRLLQTVNFCLKKTESVTGEVTNFVR